MINNVLKEDLNIFAKTFKFAEMFKSSTFLITGATGLIGSALVRCLMSLHQDISITCPVRNIGKAQALYGRDFDKINFIECDLIEFLSNMEGGSNYQYIIHCAAPTSGKYITEHPVETYELLIRTTGLILKYIQAHNAKSMVYVSSLEYYGQNNNDDIITEEMSGYIDSNNPRSSYPLGKRAAEYLCFAYSNEYKLPIKIARLTQTFGAGVSEDDNRVFAQFARSVIQGKNIVLHTKGESSKPYCYTTDCVSAILTILLKGQDGEAYNVANDATYISIRKMAEFFRDNFNSQINIVVEEHPEMGYAPITKLHLSSQKLLNLGWKPIFGLKDMSERLIKSLE